MRGAPLPTAAVTLRLARTVRPIRRRDSKAQHTLSDKGSRSKSENKQIQNTKLRPIIIDKLGEIVMNIRILE